MHSLFTYLIFNTVKTFLKLKGSQLLPLLFKRCIKSQLLLGLLHIIDQYTGDQIIDLRV